MEEEGIGLEEEEGDMPCNIPLTSADSQGLPYGHVVFLDVLANYWIDFTTVFSHCISRKVLYDFCDV